VFHAAGPGHGKVVISGWLVATEQQLRRGVLVSFLSALIQALSAILLVTAIVFVVRTASTAARLTAEIMESTSYALIALLGVYLLATSLQTVVRGRHHSPRLACDHDEDHRGHSHGPQASELDRDWSVSKAFSIAFAVGIRPCTGAILVLIFAAATGIYWAGIIATFLMALGTAITVSAIACAAVLSKKLALRLARHDDRWLKGVETALRFGGGIIIAVLGTLLFVGSLDQSSSFV
jgi:ABC-type nickel/cobalt efflux system permease component RcnA